MADFNPYLQGNSLVIPDSSGIPLSLLNNVISQYYRALIERQNQPQQPGMGQQIATSVGPVINQFANRMLDQQFGQENEAYKTDQAIRQKDAEQEALYSRNTREAGYADQLAQDASTRQGQGLAGVQGTYQDMVRQAAQQNGPGQPTQGDVTPFTPPSDMPVGPQERNPYEDTPSTGGSIFRSGTPGGPTIGMSKPGVTPPSIFDALTAYSRGNPALAGSYLSLGKTDPGVVTRGTDPLAQQKEQTGIDLQRAQADAAGSLGRSRDSSVGLNEARAEKEKALAGKLTALSATEEGRRFAQEYLQNNFDKMTQNEIAMWQQAATGKVVKTSDQLSSEAYYGATNKEGGRIDARTAHGLPGDKPGASNLPKPPQAGSINALRLELQRLVDRAGTPAEQPDDKRRIPWLAKQIKDSQTYNVMRDLNIGGGDNMTPIPQGGGGRIDPRKY